MVRFARGLQVGVRPDDFSGRKRDTERALGSHPRTGKNPRGVVKERRLVLRLKKQNIVDWLVYWT
jgi:hypothetical protein